MENQMLVDAYAFFEADNKEDAEKRKLEDLLVDIACEFINYRAANNMTQKELAERLNMTQAMVSKLESGEYNPTVKMLFEIAEKLSWTFSIQFSNNVGNMQYSFEDLKTEPGEEYFENMGFAS